MLFVSTVISCRGNFFSTDTYEPHYDVLWNTNKDESLAAVWVTYLKDKHKEKKYPGLFISTKYSFLAQKDFKVCCCFLNYKIKILTVLK